jgi:hypothetical protein
MGKIINMIASDMNQIEPVLIYIFVIPIAPFCGAICGAILWVL